MRHWETIRDIFTEFVFELETGYWYFLPVIKTIVVFTHCRDSPVRDLPLRICYLVNMPIPTSAKKAPAILMKLIFSLKMRTETRIIRVTLDAENIG